MSIQNLQAFNPFDDSGSNSSSYAGKLIHIRLQQRNGRKCLTTVEGVKVPRTEKNSHEKKILKTWKQSMNCNGTMVPKNGAFIYQLQGNQCEAVKHFLIEQKFAESRQIQVHGWNADD